MNANPPKSAPPAVKSARRVLEILELFDVVQRDMSLTEIASALGYPPSSASAILHSLTELGYLTVDQRNRAFRPTARVTLLGSWVNAAYFRDGALHRMLEDLGRRTGETIILAVQTGLIVRYIHILQGTNPMRLHVQPGATRPLGYSGIGRAFLARYAPDEQRRIASRLNAYREPHEPLIDLRELMDDLRKIRSTGYAVSANRVTPGAGVVARLLPSSADDRPLAVGVGGRADVIQTRHREFAEQIGLVVGLHLVAPSKTTRSNKPTR